MNIQPQIKKSTITIIVVITLVIITIVIVVVKTKDDSSTQKQTSNQASSFLTSKIDPNFLRFFNQGTKAEKPAALPKKPAAPLPKNTAPPKITPSSAPTQMMAFDKLFNQKHSKNNNNAVVNYLLAANQLGEVKTYIEFEHDNNNKNNKPDKTIKPNYNSLGIANTKASYPVDFSRTFTADRRISAILIEDIDSTLGGKVTAQIENNIYAAHGTNILIPIGSKAIGFYKPLERIGKSRLQIIWTRIITPLGVNIIINAELSDAMGRSGLAGTIDSKFFDRYGLAILVSTVSAIAQASVNVNSQRQAVFVNTYGKELSNLSAKILEEQIDIKPSIKIPAGSRILISPTQDIWFRDLAGDIIIEPLIISKGEPS